MTSKNYNSEREKLIFPEYGRHIQKMARKLIDIEDREERTRQAHIVVGVMGNLNSVLRDTIDFKHKLWDHLFILSDHKLDVDFPYVTPTTDILTLNPEPLEYPTHFKGYKQYGNNIRRMIKVLQEQEICERRENTTTDILKFMKFKSYEYNKEFPSNEVVINDFRKFSNGEIKVDEDILDSTKINTKKKIVNSSSNIGGGYKKDNKTNKISAQSSQRANKQNTGASSQQNGAHKRYGNTPQQGTKRFFRHSNETNTKK